MTEIANTPAIAQSPTQPPSLVSVHPGDHFAIRFAPLSLDEVYGLADDAANGAIVVMSGMVRNHTDGKSVVALEYQAYEPMALRVFQKIAAEIRASWTDVTHVVIHHRVGRLGIGEISVLVAVGCPHRSEAFAACKYAIDTLKHNAPIWKKEHWADGSTSWVSIGACEQPVEDC
ncbi:MAG: molybdenum cofactor biosynthesis protein MoaE [Oscillatoriales cyanobacterium C42_A2020_001]|nr:molybdenum cofactor biosynthesis protein MoaE [Leptolyngbyaceae cyanobacterium C42_A2020_001]